MSPARGRYHGQASRRLPCRMTRRGMTLVELLAAVVLLGAAAGLVLPAAAGFRDRLVVERETAAIAAAWTEARRTAALQGRPVWLELGADRLVVRVAVAGDTLAAWSRPGPAASGVQLTPAMDRVRIAPSGMALGVANGRITLRRGAVARAWVVSRLGRLRLERRPRHRARTGAGCAPRCRGSSGTAPAPGTARRSGSP